MLTKEKLFGLRNYVTVKITTDCNLKCSYCYQNQSIKENNKEFIDKSKMEKILEKCYFEYFKKEKFHLTLIGGEITIFEKNLIECLKIIKSKKKYISTLTIVTNGTILTDNLIESFLEIKKEINLRIIVSRDIIKEKHDKERLDKNNNPTYNSITDNIKKLKEKKIEYTISSVFNFDYDFSKVIDQIVEDTNIIGEYSLEYNKEKKYYNDILCDELSDYFIKILNKEINKKIDLGYNGLHLKHLKDVIFRKDFGITMCDIGNLYSFLPNGDILSCHQFCSMEESNTKLVGVGNIEEKEKIKNYFETYKALKEKEMSCYNCELIGCCQGACSRVSGNFKCIPWRRIQALKIFESWKKIINIDNFLEKYIEYMEENFDDYSIRENKELYENKIKKIFLNDK